jgi:hypothetical protein
MAQSAKQELLKWTRLDSHHQGLPVQKRTVVFNHLADLNLTGKSLDIPSLIIVPASFSSRIDCETVQTAPMPTNLFFFFHFKAIHEDLIRRPSSSKLLALIRNLSL